MYISLAVGLYYTMNAFMPIIAWYGWRREPIKSMTTNKLYSIAWYMLYASHFIVFLPMSILWPFTYLGSSVVVEFYDLANTMIGTIGGGSVILLVSLFWMMSVILYKDNKVISRRAMLQEMFLYILIEGFSWYVSIWEWPNAKA